MKTGIITAVKSFVTETISPKKAEKAAANIMKDGGAAKIDASQDALASQGKALVKTYVKPNAKVEKVQERNLQSSSSGWDPGDETGRGGRGGGSYSSRSSEFDDVWDSSW